MTKLDCLLELLGKPYEIPKSYSNILIGVEFAPNLGYGYL